MFVLKNNVQGSEARAGMRTHVKVNKVPLRRADARFVCPSGDKTNIEETALPYCFFSGPRR